MANVLEILLDENNKEDLVLTDEEGKKYLFSQVAVIPFKKKIYAILHPRDTDEEIAYVFKVDNNQLVIESDEKIAKVVFDEYLSLLENQGGN